ncbi:MAG: AMMECR1 domain-containing protein, partial [Nitrospirae bacterium]|nr:AMMECR1 domain-containing protein [Nitrospirota bacterium]
MHPTVKLAKNTIDRYIKEGIKITSPLGLPVEMRASAGVFVSIKKKGELRGCIGTFSPTTENIASEIIQNAISAATQDPRFFPVDVSE